MFPRLRKRRVRGDECDLGDLYRICATFHLDNPDDAEIYEALNILVQHSS